MKADIVCQGYFIAPVCNLLSVAREKFVALITEAVDNLDVNQARREVEPFVKNTDALEVWSREFFQNVVKRIVVVQASA